MLPIPYNADRKRAEQILISVARKETVKLAEIGEESLAELERRYMMNRSDLEPRVFFRLTDNWLEMSLRFVAPEHGTRKLKDAMSRLILDEFDRAEITVASSTYDIVGLPPVKVQVEPQKRTAP